MLEQPRFIECHRLHSFTDRGIDVDVILDLMIHDLDVILSLCGGEPATVEAVGVAVLTDSADIANASRQMDSTDMVGLVRGHSAPSRVCVLATQRGAASTVCRRIRLSWAA